MSEFLRGMASLGQLYPNPTYEQYTINQYSSWLNVSNSFIRTGNNIRKALKEFENAQRKEKQTK